MAGRYPEQGRRASGPHGVVPAAARLMCYLQPRHLYSPTKSDSWRSGGDTQFSSSRRFWKVPSQKTLVVPASSLLDLWWDLLGQTVDGEEDGQSRRRQVAGEGLRTGRGAPHLRGSFRHLSCRNIRRLSIEPAFVPDITCTSPCHRSRHRHCLFRAAARSRVARSTCLPDLASGDLASLRCSSSSRRSSSRCILRPATAPLRSVQCAGLLVRARLAGDEQLFVYVGAGGSERRGQGLEARRREGKKCCWTGCQPDGAKWAGPQSHGSRTRRTDSSPARPAQTSHGATQSWKYC